MKAHPNIEVDLDTDETDTRPGSNLVWSIVGLSIGLMAVGLIVGKARGVF